LSVTRLFGRCRFGGGFGRFSCGGFGRFGRSGFGRLAGGLEWDAIKFGNELGCSLNLRTGEIAILSTFNTLVQAKRFCDVAVRFGVSVSTSSIASLGDGWSSAFACVERTATLLAIRILLAGSSDKSISANEET